MIPDKDIWRAALLMMKRYDAAATLEAAIRVDAMLAEGDIDGCATG